MIDSLTFIVLLSFLVNILLGQECILPKQIIHFRLFKSHSHINGWNNGFYSIFRLNENIEFLYQGTFSGLGLVQVESHCLDSNANFLVSLSQPTISNDIEIGLEVFRIIFLLSYCLFDSISLLDNIFFQIKVLIY